MDKAALEEGTAFAPRFDANGLIVCVTVETATREFMAYMYLRLSTSPGRHKGP